MVISKKGQVTIFIVLGIILVAGIVLYYVFRGGFTGTVSKNFQSAEDAYKSCITERVKSGIKLLGEQGGYIYTEELPFESGSIYAPSSSQLDFGGAGVPYWFYVSGNNVVKEQIPTKSQMVSELERFISESMRDCNFKNFNDDGIFIDVDSGNVEVEIKDNSVEVVLDNNVYFFSEDNTSAVVSEHKISVASKIGKFYDLAQGIYDTQSRVKFLDNYALDTLTLNAPTVGFEEGCVPKVFNFANIRQNISDALVENIQFVKISGDYYLNSDDYFVVDDMKTDESVDFVYFSDWPTKIEIYGDDVVEPVGLQPGMNALGFCFVEYQLIYDLMFPVLIQVHDDEEFFQFPVIVMIERNQVRNSTNIGEFVGEEEVICKNRNHDMKIGVSDLNGNPVAATLSYSCLGERCYLGETKSGPLQTKIPVCINGYIEARAENYSSGRYVVSSSQESSADVLVKKVYTLGLNLGSVSGNAIVQFTSDDFSRSVMYPAERKIELVEGVYNVSVQVFRNSSLTFPARTESRCFEVPATGFGALTGEVETKCFTTEMPSQTIDQVLNGGGKSVEFFDDYSLSQGGTIAINVPIFSLPQKIEDINENYIKFEDSVLSVGLEQ
jgi:hypothetical protein